MATGKGVIQGYAAQAAVDSAHQVNIAANVIGSGSEQSMLLRMIEKTAPYREAHTLITADAGYHSDANVEQLKRQEIPALITNNQMRQREQRIVCAHSPYSVPEGTQIWISQHKFMINRSEYPNFHIN